MSLLLPLGLLGLLGLVALLIIYILKPNYQQKVVSSTFVWKLSLRYRKKSVPISKFRNLLILLCQILILTACALILSMPVIAEEAESPYREEILILDSSASMYAEHGGETRFERAVSRIGTAADSIFAENGYVTIIVAGNEAAYLAERATVEDQSEIRSLLAGLTCSYGEADVEGAMRLAEEVLELNPAADVLFYTATKYADAGDEVILQDVSAEGEWNAAILGASAVLVDNYYTITVDIACYGADESFDLHCEVNNANGTTDSVILPAATVYCSGDQTYQVVYTVSEAVFGDNVTPIILTDNDRIYSFDSIFLYISGADSLTFDNEYYIYGGNKPSIRIEYCSSLPNNFVSGMLLALSSQFRDQWDITITQVNTELGEEPILQGFDLYIFEHEMPETLPTDGVVFMMDPDIAADAGFTLGRVVEIPDWSGDGAALAQGVEHPILNNVTASGILVTKYTQVDEDSLDGYDVLLYFEGNPVFFVKNEPNSKIAVMAFSLHNSNLPISLYFPIILYNFFDYYFPETIDGTSFNVYDTVTLNARGTDLTVTDSSNETMSFTETPAQLLLDSIGTYTITQKLMPGNSVADRYQTERIYVTIPRLQSNIARTEDELAELLRPAEVGMTYDDLMVYIAAVAVALLMVEWLLQWRKGI